jgi:hypothetical protein
MVWFRYDLIYDFIIGFKGAYLNVQYTTKARLAAL